MLNQYILRHGLIYAAISVIITIVLYILGADFFANNMMVISILLLLIAIIYPIIVVSRFRKDNGGYCTFIDAFKCVFGVLILAGAIGLIFNIVMYGFIDTEYPKQINEKVMIKTMEFMQKMGASEDDINKAMEQAQSNNRFEIAAQIKGFLFSAVFYALYALILAAIFKKDKPVFDTTPQA
ncbi:MAG: hypothetical protein RIQ89_719 [Bacteroidota bacterium]|jgi:uncharacterized membrane protein (DUF106 family)